MRVKGVFEFIGVQDIQGKKDVTKVYHNVALMQDTDVVKVFANDDTVKLFSGIKKMDKVECELNINIGAERSYLGINSVKKLSA